ncbi:MAG: LacI family DNA-binding transcriptional regulator [Deinococcota bacterium]
MSSKRKRVTSQQVADLAGVSRTTVSFVLNDTQLSKSISPETRNRVLRAAKELNYVPDAAARTLASGQTQTLGVVVADTQHLEVDAFIAKLLFKLTDVSREHGFKMLIETVDEIHGGDAYQRLVSAKQIDGLLVVNPRADDHALAEIVNSPFPVVLLGSMGNPNEYVVTHAPGAHLVVDHLISLGHTRIAHISYGPMAYQSARLRLEQYQQRLEHANLPPDPELIRYGNFSAESGFEAMQSLLDLAQPPTAVFAGNDTIAFGVLAAIRERGLQVPEDVAVVGFDNLPLASYASPPLTTVQTSAIQQGQAGGEMLIQRIRGEVAEQQRIIETKLIVRESCGSSTH